MADHAEYHNDYDRDRSGSNWMWLLMLPLFFFGGWWANDLMTQGQNTGPEAGVGGAPYVEEPSRSTLSPSPFIENEDVSPSPSTEPMNSFDQDGVLDTDSVLQNN